MSSRALSSSLLALDVPSAWNVAVPAPTDRILTSLLRPLRLLALPQNSAHTQSTETVNMSPSYFPVGLLAPDRGFVFANLLAHFLHTLGAQYCQLQGIDSMQLRASGESSGG